MHPPPSPARRPNTPIVSALPPLHPTLQQLAPNPLAVTYAASLRPLPPDPLRRYTGSGIGGGAIHHRGPRKPQFPVFLSGAAGNSSPSAAFAPTSSAAAAQSLANLAQVAANGGMSGPNPGAAALIASLTAGSPISLVDSRAAGPAGTGQSDLWRWYVRARASPGAGLVAKADKCLLTSDWRAAYTEQKFVRAMGKIERLKHNNEWSFRQPRKQKSPVIRKAHWDHLLEEMKWLQTDFREERRWKVAAAYHLAHACRAWHRASTREARAAMCVRSATSPITSSGVVKAPKSSGSRKRKAAEMNGEGSRRGGMTSGGEIRAASPSKELHSSVSRSADAQKHSSQGSKAKVKVEPKDDLMDTDEQAKAAATDGAEGPGHESESKNLNGMSLVSKTTGAAEGDDVDADGDLDDGEVEAATKVDGPMSLAKSEAGLDEEMPIPNFSVDPPVKKSSGEQESNLRDWAPTKDATLAEPLPMNLITNLRAPIFAKGVDVFVVTPTELLTSVDPHAAAVALGQDDSDAASRLEGEELSLDKLFPELPTFAGLAPLSAADKQERRPDEGSYHHNRLTHVTRLLESKPVLVSTLNPAKNRMRGEWTEGSEWTLAADSADPLKGMTQEAVENMLLHAPPPNSTLFTKKTGKAPKEPTASGFGIPTAPAQPDARAANFYWTTEEDNLLMALARQYKDNWQLVSDMFNSTFMTVPTDKREAWDCYDRYKRVHGAISAGKSPPGPPPLPTPEAVAGATTGDDPANPNLPSNSTATSNSLAAKRAKIAKKLRESHDGSRKSFRHANLVDVIRKGQKRREQAKQNPNGQANNPASRKVNFSSHDSHAPIKSGPVPTPQQLSNIKVERDQIARRQYLVYQQEMYQQHQAVAQAQVQAQAQAQAQAQLDAQNQAAAAAAAQQRASMPPPQQPNMAMARPGQQHPMQTGGYGGPQQQQQQSAPPAQGLGINRVPMPGQITPQPPTPQAQPQQVPTPQQQQQQPQQQGQNRALGQPGMGLGQMAQMAAAQNNQRPQAGPSGSAPQNASQQYAQQQQQTARAGMMSSAPPPNGPGQGQNQGQASSQNAGGQAGLSSGGMPIHLQQLQQQLAISLANQKLSQEQINTLAFQLYRQAQQQQQQQQAALQGRTGPGQQPPHSQP